MSARPQLALCAFAALLALPLAAGEKADNAAKPEKAAAPWWTLTPADRRAVEALVRQLAGTDAVLARQAEEALPGYGPGVKAYVEPLAASGHELKKAAADRLLAHPGLNENLPRVRLHLKRGTIEVVLFEDAAPNTVANFLDLAGKRFYDGTRFHSVIEKFLAQGGDPTGTGRGGPGYRIADEIDAAALGLDKTTALDLTKQLGHPPPPQATAALTLQEIYTKQGYRYKTGLPSRPVRRGALAMAGTRRPDSGGSQFFIATIDCPWLDGKHTVFGQVVGGQALVDSMKPDETLERVEILHKQDHPYTVSKLEERQ